MADGSPRRLSVANAYTGSTPTPVSPPTPQGCPPAVAPVPGVDNPNTCAPQGGVAYNAPAMPGFPQGPFSYAPGLWVHADMPPFMVPVRHPGSCGTCSPPPISPELATPKGRRSGDASSSRRKSLRRADTPYLLQRCGPFFAWQLVIMWMAVLGTVVFVCTFGAFRHYLMGLSLESSDKAKESALKNANLRRMHRSPAYMNASCGIQNPCRGVGMLCIGRHCHCGPDFEEQGELCSPKRNVRSEDGVDVPLSTSVPYRRSRKDAGRDASGPLQGVHKKHSLNTDVDQRRPKAMRDASTKVFANIGYEDSGHRHALNSPKSLESPKSPKSAMTTTSAPTLVTKDRTRIAIHRKISRLQRSRLSTTKKSTPVI